LGAFHQHRTSGANVGLEGEALARSDSRTFEANGELGEVRLRRELFGANASGFASGLRTSEHSPLEEHSLAELSGVLGEWLHPNELGLICSSRNTPRAHFKCHTHLRKTPCVAYGESSPPMANSMASGERIK